MHTEFSLNRAKMQKNAKKQWMQWQLPVLLETALTYLGDMCVPLSLLVIGSNLAKSMQSGLGRITADQIVIMLGKFAVHPLLVWGMFTLAGVDGLPLGV